MSGAEELAAIAARLRELSNELAGSEISDEDAEARATEAAELASRAGAVLEQATREIAAGSSDD